MAENKSSPIRGEQALIQRIKQVLARQYGPQNPADCVPFGDDMAVLSARHPNWLWTTDMLMDGVDFDSRQHAWRQIGRKALAVNLSDCAAMGCTPVSALCAVALNNLMSMDAAVELLEGVVEQGAVFECPVIGGDTNSWDAPLVISITVAGEARDGPPVRRDAAQPGDRIFVSGRLGGSILGRHLSPTPRIALGRTLCREPRAHAMIDISDGLALDLWRICEASGYGAMLDETGLLAAVHEDARRLERQDGVPALRHALHDGEDFELIVVLPADVAEVTTTALGLTEVGGITALRELSLRHGDGRISTIEPRGWEHFR